MNLDDINELSSDLEMNYCIGTNERVKKIVCKMLCLDHASVYAVRQ